MNSKLILTALTVAAILPGCSQPSTAPNIDVQLPSQQVGRWEMHALPTDIMGGQKYLFLDTTNGTTCIVQASDIATNSFGVSLDSFPGDFVNKHCKKLPQ
ncbi:hypothetical protein [Pseudoxanthomonas mexicana]